MSHEAIEAAAAEAKLELCPFCGGSAEWQSGKYADGAEWSFIACSQCEAQGPHVMRETLTYKDACVRSWNNRT
ncbi:Lar family restriction alleviation protein [Roseibium alexandrii]